MSTTGRRDDAGDPGSSLDWKDGFNLKCGVPTTLLNARRSSGPWCVCENVRAPKQRFYVVRLGADKWTTQSLADLKHKTAWVGADRMIADILVERLNGYEMARDFPPKAVTT